MDTFYQYTPVVGQAVPPVSPACGRFSQEAVIGRLKIVTARKEQQVLARRSTPRLSRGEQKRTAFALVDGYIQV